VITRPFRLEQPHGVIRGDVRIPEGPPPRTAVVLVHGFKGYKDWGFFPWLAERLVADRHAVVSVNLTGCGIGSRDPHGFTELDAFAENTFSREVADVLAVLDALRAGLLPRSPDRVGLFGHSRGGADAVLAAHRRPVDALVTWAAVSDLWRWSDETVATWREQGRIYALNSRTGQQMPLDVTLLEDLEENREALDVTAAASALTCPWLVVHGTDDHTVDPSAARTLAAAGASTRLHLVEGGDHTFRAVHPFAGVPHHLASAADATRRHLRTHLRPD
jgi:pimeloyl-ACP methyl ester carboxylesterase